MTEETGVDPATVGGDADAPPVAAKPYKVVFEANRCIGAGQCLAASDNWTVNVESGIAVPRSFYLDDETLVDELEAARVCPAKNGRGVIHVIDRRTGDELAPDPHGDGTVSVDW